MDQCYDLCLTGHLLRKKLKWTLQETVQSNFSIPAMLIGTIDFYHFMSLSLALALPGGHKLSAKQNLLVSCSPPLFIQ